ncbi:ABC transporter permease [Rhodopirellula sp. SWK7]|uniref:ABC transporter permease n=1 Tax=Rhodopirellula sp. SWK7 TaxID=595460 RepID=UPI0002BE9A2B|nr:ABC transporter permease [Rhodopirellula sp. SWK7]EMI44086.1 membrane protein [Rhodopirellula sp. SWK7]
MSRTSIPSRPWLIWNESMQLTPLVLSLFAIVSVLAAIQYSLWESRLPSFYSQLEWTLLILPVVFAVGAGAISVGFEREQRTLETLSLLPISRTKLVGTKVFVSLVGQLGAMDSNTIRHFPATTKEVSLISRFGDAWCSSIFAANPLKFLDSLPDLNCPLGNFHDFKPTHYS